MKKERSKPVEFKITGDIKGVKKSEIKDGIFETRDNALIAILRVLPDNRARQVFKERVS